ncbi:pantetheine-phosphate adenylyltransferase [Demequina capsici]|uniref:Phosphopantetheine adenylyltransferase n=1 Tax=Demequina capsici TaxID=3075620 RepID=A0AA96FF44_9MICO|nr:MULTISPECIES: pantetheine-phosphate adenylyltransferase [unclassified Demequina]WNM25387.1 pantetheine-phosphate adenylyltransferase [Demequina sp. OYTSA14]WNM28267.1 pantetheine-phosphate adenylyltransferase [Demequina sp. PMTSA13]
MTIAVFPGSFDPITLGHVDVALRARTIFERVIIAVAHNSTKSPLLDAQTRLELAREATAHLDGIEVATTDGLLVEFCESVGANAIVKGLRGGADYDVERPMALMNRSITGIETVFLTGDNALSHIASSLVRDVARHGGDITAYVPRGVESAVLRALGRDV